MPSANRMSLLGKDAELALQYLVALQDLYERTPGADPKGTLRSALMHAAIVVYARSFKRNEGDRGEVDPRADFSKLAVSGEEAMMALHLRIIEARDTMIAHSDWDKRRTEVVQRHGEHAVVRWTTMTRGWECIDERAFARLATVVSEQAGNLAFDLERLR